MRRYFTLGILLLMLLPSCSKKTGTTITVVKPKYHHGYYNAKKHKHLKRTKKVRVQN